MTEPITIVTGLGRCGTTAMMGALRAGGMPILATPTSPLNEYVRPPGESWRETMLKARGKVLKILNGLAPLGDLYQTIPTRAIWMMRDPEQQAKSTYKFLRALYPDRKLESVETIKQDIQDRTPKYIAIIERLHCALLIVQFEHLLETPRRVVDALVDWLDEDLDRRAMVESIYRRNPDVYEGFLEKELYERRTGQCVPLSALDTRTLASGTELRELPAEGEAPSRMPAPAGSEEDSTSR